MTNQPTRSLREKLEIGLHDAFNAEDKPCPGCTPVMDKLMPLIERMLAEQHAAVIEYCASKLERVAAAYAVGGHSHRAQMLKALATEFRRVLPTDVAEGRKEPEK